MPYDNWQSIKRWQRFVFFLRLLFTHIVQSGFNVSPLQVTESDRQPENTHPTVSQTGTTEVITFDLHTVKVTDIDVCPCDDPNQMPKMPY